MSQRARERRPVRQRATPSIEDVARSAGVAVGTVSNVLNRPERVAETTRRRVEAAIAHLGFVRNSAARSLAAGTTDTVGMVLVDIGNSFFVDIARGAEAATAEAGLNLLLANSDVDQVRQDSYLKLFDEARAAGLILAPLDGPLTVAHTVRDHGRPVVLVNAPVVDGSACSVVVNEELGGSLAAEHLLAQGCRRLAFVGGPFHLRAIRLRLRGAQQAAARASSELVVVETPDLKIGSGRAAAEQLLTRTEPVDGILCSSDPLAIGVIAGATEQGVRIPEDLAVIGYDDNHLAAERPIPISSMAQPGFRMGQLATQLLLDEIAQAEHQHEAVVVEPQLIARRSSQRSAASA
jgi:LacI family transcriptional regulator